MSQQRATLIRQADGSALLYTSTAHASRLLPSDTRTRMQTLLNEGDHAFFDRKPSETERRRLYFKGEAITGEAKPSRYVIVKRQEDGTLVRRFEQVGGQA